MDTRVESLLAERREKFAPNSVVLVITDTSAQRLAETAPFLAQLERKGRITLYECRNFACELPKVIA